MTDHRTIAIRIADSLDSDGVRRLAELDSVPELREPALLALIDGEPAAALSLVDGRIAADPFAHTAAAVTLLRARALGLQRSHARRRARKAARLRLRLA